MSSALETLLEAARFIELQEQKLLSSASSPQPILSAGRSNNQNYNSNSHYSNDSKTSWNCSLVSPPISPVNAITERDLVENHIEGNHREYIEFNNATIYERGTEVRRANHTTSIASNNNYTSNNINIINNGCTNNFLVATAEDSSQSSLNLSSSGYLSGSSVNSTGSIGSNASNASNIISNALSSQLNGDLHIPVQIQASSRKRTTSTNSNNGSQRSPCILRAGTREVHNKLEKHRRAHLKECFEQLKSQLLLKDEEKKKTSNLAILGAAYRHVMSLKRKERDLEQQVERLAKEKINSQKKILILKKEIATKQDNVDYISLVSEGDIGNISGERDSMCDSVSLSSGRGSTRYSSSSSLSSTATVSSPLDTSINGSLPVISSASCLGSPNKHHSKLPSPPRTLTQLTMIAKNITSSPSTCASPLSSSSTSSLSNGISCSTSGILSSSPPNRNSSPLSLKIPNTSNGIKFVSSTSPSGVSLVSSTMNNRSSPIISQLNENVSFTHLTSCVTPLNFNTSHNLQISSTLKDINTKNGICRKNPEKRDSSPPTVVIANNAAALNNLKDLKVEKIFEDGEQPTKVIKLFNGIALAPVDKDNKILSSTPLALSQVVGSGGLVVSPFPMLTTSSHGLRVIGPNGLATIELSSPTVQPQSKTNQLTQATSVNTLTTNPGAQLHKLLVGSATTATNVSGSTNVTAASELARLPGGAELNLLPAGVNGTTVYRGSGKLAIVNNGITLKGADASGSGNRAVHVVTPIQSGTSPLSGLAPIVVSQGQTHIITSSPQLAGKVNLSVGGQTLPLISTQYLSSMKPMVVAVANNSTPTLSSVPPTTTTTALAITASANGTGS